MIVMSKVIYIKLQEVKVSDKCLRPLYVPQQGRSPRGSLTTTLHFSHIHHFTYTPTMLDLYHQMKNSLNLKKLFQKFKHDIIGLAEIRRMGYDILEDQDHINCYYGKTKGEYGVGFQI
ncbi:unnamed protein product, partial [Brenthis ino]